MKKIWTLDRYGNQLERDLNEENKAFNVDRYKLGEFDSYNYMWYEMFNHHIHDDIGCDYERYGCFIRSGDVVLDLGANIGIFSHRAELRGSSKVISFEPVLPTFECLLKNKGSKTEVYNLGVGSKNEFRNFKIHTDFSNIGGGKFDMNNELSRLNIVYDRPSYVIDINDIFLQYKVDFIKMDIEGGEIEVLNHITDKNLNSIRCLALELHGNQEEFRKNFLERIQNMGFNHFTLHYANDLLKTINIWKN